MNARDVVAETVVGMQSMMKLKRSLFPSREIKIMNEKEKENVVVLGTVNVRRIAKKEIIIAETSKASF